MTPKLKVCSSIIETWDEKTEDSFLIFAAKDFVESIEISGGEPLTNKNAKKVLHLVQRLKTELPDKVVRLCTALFLDEIILLPDQLSAVRLVDELAAGRGNDTKLIDMPKTLKAGYTIEKDC